MRRNRGAQRWKLESIAKMPDSIATYYKDKTTNLVRVPLGIAGFPGMVIDYTPNTIPAVIPPTLYTPYDYQTEAVNKLIETRY
jgi:hypothetical protein